VRNAGHLLYSWGIARRDRELQLARSVDREYIQV
jgi:hypothetical protein